MKHSVKGVELHLSEMELLFQREESVVVSDGV